MSLEHVVANLVEKVERRYYGKYRGFVVNNDDPQRLGRLTLQVPSVLGEDVVTGWAWPCAPYGGAAGQGMLFIPEKKAGVWVEFEEGDLEFPIWVGTFWSAPDGKSELPHPNGVDGSEDGAVQKPPTRKIIKTLKGHTIQFEDDDGDEMITIVEAKHIHVITMNKDGITITDGVNHNKITLGSDGITVQSSGTEILVGSQGVLVGGSGATESFVLGTSFDKLMTSFNTLLNSHTHTGNLGAPTSPPVTPMKLSVPLSSKHKVE